MCLLRLHECSLSLTCPCLNSVKGKIVTELAPLKKWYNAEDYHQDYLFENPNGELPNSR